LNLPSIDELTEQAAQATQLHEDESGNGELLRECIHLGVANHFSKHC
jgi:hypothetical protein